MHVTVSQIAVCFTAVDTVYRNPVDRSKQIAYSIKQNSRNITDERVPAVLDIVAS